MRVTASSVNTKEEFIAFVKALSTTQDQESWENTRLPEYLSALAGWTEDMEGYFTNVERVGTPNPSWKLFAIMLEAATIYE